MSYNLQFSADGAAKNYIEAAEASSKLYDFPDASDFKSRSSDDRVSIESNGNMHLAVIDYRKLELECLTRGFRSRNANIEASAFSDIDGWRNTADIHDQVSAILFNIGWRNAADQDVVDAVKSLATDFPGIPTIVIGDVEDMAHVMKILEYGARGYIPTSVGLDVAIEAVRLARAGGIFVPASSLASFRQHLSGEKPHQSNAMDGLFTARQAAVADALRRGKANKIIAYELNLCESTVKVHIRNIMKKLKAKNRTEVAYKINDMMPRGSGPDRSVC
ncbi:MULTISPECIES: response regulator transcription factor [Inquilinus]|uniref:DNA-binding NarL/FixJ family response regulator n=1 Tax=Inquilinus ginsengisoli TaxID=363840 RepID=A0ABU1JI23_9PROT|nr:response regulator transcription factor [Inquilinus ginsengisoli]MDR6288260.1 DNA-binding NarL/FixJ family response regulator [Inquilinus ginsengisoli]